jgi:uncharacterized protein with PQ loop repeat
MDLTDIISYIGTAMAIFLVGAQIPAMYIIIFKTKKVDENLSVGPTIGQFCNFVAWVVYAIVAGIPAILRVNGIGSGFAIIYQVIFVMYSSGKLRRNLVIAILAAWILLATLSAAIIIPPQISQDLKVQLLGYIAVVFNVYMYGAPISQLRIALKSMDPNDMPLILTIAGTLCSISWLVYGLLTWNWFVAGPNIAGTALSFIQIGVAIYITVYGKKKSASSDEKIANEDAETGDYSSLLENAS